MTLRDMNWTKREKEIARRAFDAAYRRECAAIADMLRTMTATGSEPADIWRIHDPEDKFIVLIKEMERDNIGVGGKLLSEILPK